MASRTAQSFFSSAFAISVGDGVFCDKDDEEEDCKDKKDGDVNGTVMGNGNPAPPSRYKHRIIDVYRP
jgi:hypothetical protein